MYIPTRESALPRSALHGVLTPAGSQAAANKDFVIEELQQQLDRVQRGLALAVQELIVSQDKANTVDLDSSSMLVRVRV